MSEMPQGEKAGPEAGKEAEKARIAERIESERREARERFGSLIASVSARYEKLPTERMRTDFENHNGEILDGAIELAIRNGFSEGELRELELAAILHDATKSDPVPEKYAGVPNYVLASHGQSGARLAAEVLTDEELAKHFSQSDPESFKRARQSVSQAILEHMGPRPGFMSGIIESANAKLREMGEPELDCPAAEGKISGALLAADMRSLAGAEGRRKVIGIRSAVELFRRQDEATVKEYEMAGIGLVPAEAAILSGFKSAFEARDMIGNEAFREWVNEAIERSLDCEYDIGDGRKATGREVLAKQSGFERANREKVIQ